jgi:hypothetical protein
MARPPSQRISVWDLRKLFNDGGYWAKAQAGELCQQLMTDRHPSSPKANVPICTQSQLISYLNAAGQEIARVHQYLQPDGTLGASGKPDPKRLLHEGILYFPTSP